MPVANLRHGSEGISAVMTLPSDHMNTTAPMPIVIMIAVPKNSLRYSDQFSLITLSSSEATRMGS
jgi:hypothetical protein